MTSRKKPAPSPRSRRASAKKGTTSPTKRPRSPHPALPGSEPEAPSLPTQPEAHAPPAPPSQPHRVADLPAAPPAPQPSSEAPSGSEEPTGAGPKPAREEEAPAEPESGEADAVTEDEDDEGGEPEAVEAAPRRPRGVAPELPLRVESLLFAASKPVNVHDLVARLGGDVDHVQVQRALRKLQRAYANRNTSLEVRRAGDAWALQVREEYLEVAHKVTPVDIPGRSLRVLALVAFHQPIRQSVLARMVGEIAYSEVKSLRDMGFLHAVAKASTLELTTTSRFAEYFGLESTDRDKIRERLAQRLGIPLSAIPPPPADDPENPPPPPPGGPQSGDGPEANPPLPAE